MINSSTFCLLIVTIVFSGKRAFGNKIKENTPLTSHGCTTNDFLDFKSCTLWCTFNATDYNYINYTWTYYTTNQSISYVIDRQSTTHEYDKATNTHNITLPLRKYNSGHYECQFLVTETAVEDETYHVFQISETNGTELYAPCNTDSECMALFAVCYLNYNSYDRRCQCPSDSSVPFNDYNDTPACLKPAYLNTQCQSDNQCLAGTFDSECKEGYCQCQFGFEICSERNVCILDDSLSGGEIAGIVIGSLTGVAIVGGVVYCVIKT